MTQTWKDIRPQFSMSMSPTGTVVGPYTVGTSVKTVLNDYHCEECNIWYSYEDFSVCMDCTEPLECHNCSGSLEKWGGFCKDCGKKEEEEIN